MAEILELQEEAIIHPTAAAGSRARKHGGDTGTAAPAAPGSHGDGDVPRKEYPKGVVLGKDGKPCRSCTSAADWLRLARTHPTTTTSKPPTETTTHTTSYTTTTTPTTTTTTVLNEECPPDVQSLGRSTWAFLHTLSASYPARPTPQEKRDMAEFMGLFGKLYPCWVCADGFREWMGKEENRLVVGPPEEQAGTSEGGRGGVGGGEKLGQDLLGKRFGGGVKRGGMGTRGEGGAGGGVRQGAGGWLDSRDRFGLWMCMAHNAVNDKLGKKEFDCRKWEERWRTGCGVGEEID